MAENLRERLIRNRINQRSILPAGKDETMTAEEKSTSNLLSDLAQQLDAIQGAGSFLFSQRLNVQT